MRRLLTWLLVSLGIAALVRRLRRREKETELAPPPEQDPADELRRKLAETRSEDDAVPIAETPVEEPGAEERGVDERRSDVHGQGRAALDEMRAPDDA